MDKLNREGNMKGTRWVMVPVLAAVLAGCADALPTEDVSFNRQPAARGATIVDVALAVNAETGEFSTLIAAVVSADLVGALSAVGQRTVFAPTDEAFGKLGLNAGNIGDLDKAALTNILLYHVANGRREAADVVSSKQIRMLNGQFTKISVTAEGAFIDDAKIIGVNVPASNGIIHIIDSVLLPN
jgi:uncharacterized surface protein with fasciclin (FAS1) repeats